MKCDGSTTEPLFVKCDSQLLFTNVKDNGS